jgi:hypothetical protein
MNFEELRSPSQQFIPSIREFFEPIIDQLQTVQVPSLKGSTDDLTDNKEPSIKDLEKERERLLQQDPSLVWRALRLLARQSPYFFVHNTQTVPSMAQFLVATCEKIRREYITTITPTPIATPTPLPLPSTTNTDEEEEDTTMDDEPLENPPSIGETTNTDQENEDETATSSTVPFIPKVDEDDDDDNRERRFTSTKRTSL